MKRLRTIVLTAGITIVAAAAAIALLRLKVPSFPRPFAPKPLVTATTMLETIRDTAELQTVSGVYHIVFPHDFYIPGVQGSTLVAGMAGVGEAGLSEEEAVHLEAYNIALAAGLATDRNDDSFIVVTALVTAGYELDEPPFSGMDERAFFQEPGEDSPAHLYLPAAQILDVRIEDMSRETYAYPETNVSPGDIRRISEFVRHRVERIAVTKDLRETAREQSKLFFSALFSVGESEGIVFSSEPLAIVQ